MYLALFLFGFAAGFAILVWLATRTLAQAERWAGNAPLRKDRMVAWILLQLITAMFFAWVEVSVFDRFDDIRPWIYVSAACWVLAFSISNCLVVHHFPASRFLPLNVLRLASCFVIAAEVAKLCELAAESHVIGQRASAGVTDAHELFTWGDGGNTMTWSEGLSEISKRTWPKWRLQLSQTAAAAIPAMPFMLVLEWIRMGINPLQRSRKHPLP